MVNVNINELKMKLLAEAQGSKRRLPFKKLVVNHAEQKFLKEGEIEKPLGKEVEIFVVAEFSQYFYYDPKLERITVLSQISRPSSIKETIDLKSGRKMKEVIEKLNSQGLKPVYTTILVVMVKVGDAWEEAIFYMKGAILQSWLEIIKYLQKQETTHIAKLLKLSLKGQKKGAVKYATLSLEDYQECNDGNVISKGVLLLEKFKAEVEKYNAYEPVKEELPVEEVNEDVEDGVEF
jgi:hypothetical protein